MAFEQDWRKVPQYVAGMDKYRPLVNEVAKEYGLPPEAAEHMLGILGVESRWGLAKNLSTPGAAGELGIAQITPAFAKQYGVNPLDDRQAITGIAKYYQEQLKRGMPIDAIPIGYNAGTSRLNRYVAGELPWDKLPNITRQYVERMRQFTGGATSMPTTQSTMGMPRKQYSPPVAKTLAAYGLPTSGGSVFGDVSQQQVPQAPQVSTGSQLLDQLQNRGAASAIQLSSQLVDGGGYGGRPMWTTNTIRSVVDPGLANAYRQPVAPGNFQQFFMGA